MNAFGLNRLQAAFHDHVLGRPSAIAQLVAEGGRIDIARRLHIYHHAYRARLLETLQDAFEKTWAYLGDERFESTAIAFIEAHPPMHKNLRWYGAEFPHWLSSGFPEDPDIAELAMLDWQLRHAFDGPDAIPLPVSILAELAPEEWETVGFGFCPTLFLTPLRYNTVAIWHALDQEQTPPASARLPDPAWLLIWRKGWQPHFRTLGAIEYSALFQLRTGATFARVCECLGEQFSDRDVVVVAATYLQGWLRDELIIALTGAT
jgi:hypothetical protein